MDLEGLLGIPPWHDPVPTTGTRCEHAVEHEHMEVGLQVQCRAEALDEPDRAAQALPDAEASLRHSSLIGEECTQEAAQDLAREPRVPGTATPVRLGTRQHPLPNGYLGKNAVHEMDRPVVAPHCGEFPYGSQATGTGLSNGQYATSSPSLRLPA
jgi:hypothetical protein